MTGIAPGIRRVRTLGRADTDRLLFVPLDLRLPGRRMRSAARTDVARTIGTMAIPATAADPTEASYIPTAAGAVEHARWPVAVHRKSDWNGRRSDSSGPITSPIRPAPWAGDGARRRIESAGSESAMSRGALSTPALLRSTMERPDSVVAGQLPASGDTDGSS